MKKTALLATVVALGMLAFGLAAMAPTQLASLDDSASIDLTTRLDQATRRPPNFQPTYCGDPCSNEGQSIGCIDNTSNPWRRLICTCSNGYIVC